MIALLIGINLIWTGVALYINYSWRKNYDDTFGEFLDSLEDEK